MMPSLCVVLAGHLFIGLFRLMVTTGIPELKTTENIKWLEETLVLQQSDDLQRPHRRGAPIRCRSDVPTSCQASAAPRAPPRTALSPGVVGATAACPASACCTLHAHLSALWCRLPRPQAVSSKATKANNAAHKIAQGGSYL